jgi:hypothetical protein
MIELHEGKLPKGYACYIPGHHERINKKRIRSPEYFVWESMLTRTYRSNRLDYKYYGGRGIRVQKSWILPDGQGFLNFLADMGPRPAGHQIDRIDVNGHYTTENCRWVTSSLNVAKRRKLGNNNLPIGVCLGRTKYRARISIDNKLMHIGYFSTPEEASRAYREAFYQRHGEYPCSN